jgi:hypothetical protein
MVVTWVLWQPKTTIKIARQARNEIKSSVMNILPSRSGTKGNSFDELQMNNTYLRVHP